MAACGGMPNFETAVLLLVTVGVLVLAKSVSDLRAEVRALRERQSAPPAATADRSPADSTPRPAPALAPVPPAPDEIPADVYAAIVAAVHYTLGQEHHLVSVTPAESMMWSREGRRNIFSSHTFR